MNKKESKKMAKLSAKGRKKHEK